MSKKDYKNYSNYNENKKIDGKDEVIVEETKNVQEADTSVIENTAIAIVVPKNGLRVRRTPDIPRFSDNVIYVLKKDTRVTIDLKYKNDKWSFISAEGDKGVLIKGYVMTDFLIEVKEN